ncbi:MAG: DUF3341 domain-containing protein [Phycisphaeraceae bacterium]
MSSASSDPTTSAALTTGSPELPKRVYGLMAEFDTVDGVMVAAEAVRDAGYRKFDVHSPFPIHGIDEAMGIKPTFLPWVTLVVGLTGTLAGAFLAIYTMGIYLDIAELPEMLKGYEYLISGKPSVSLPAYIPVIFETTILAAAIATVFGMYLLNKLPMLYHPLLAKRAFRRATSDRFYVVIESRDQKYDPDRTADFLRDQGALGVEVVEE